MPHLYLVLRVESSLIQLPSRTDTTDLDHMVRILWNVGVGALIRLVRCLDTIIFGQSRRSYILEHKALGLFALDQRRLSNILRLIPVTSDK